MNGKLLSEAERNEIRRCRNRRLHLKRVRKRRDRLLSSVISSPIALALFESKILSGGQAFAALFGSIRQAKSALRSIHAVIAAASPGLPFTPCNPGADISPVATPARCLRKSRRGQPIEKIRFEEVFRAAMRVARCLANFGYVTALPGASAFFEHEQLLALIPGLNIPRTFWRRAYLVRITPGSEMTSSQLEVYSIRGLPFWRQPMRESFNLIDFDSDQKPT